MRPIQYASNITSGADADPYDAPRPRSVTGVVARVIEFGLASVGTFVIVWVLATATVLLIAR